MKKRLIIGACVASIVAVSGILAVGVHSVGIQESSAAPKDKEKKKTINGVVKSVNAANNTLVIVAKDKERAFWVAPKALIVINNKLARLVDIKKNADAKITYTMDQKYQLEAASEIWATQPLPHGKQETRPKK